MPGSAQKRLGSEGLFGPTSHCGGTPGRCEARLITEKHRGFACKSLGVCLSENVSVVHKCPGLQGEWPEMGEQRPGQCVPGAGEEPMGTEWRWGTSGPLCCSLPGTFGLGVVSVSVWAGSIRRACGQVICKTGTRPVQGGGLGVLCLPSSYEGLLGAAVGQWCHKRGGQGW